MGMRQIERVNHWRGIVEEQAASGLSVTEFCRQRSIPQPSFYYWRRRLGQVTGSTELRSEPAPAEQRLKAEPTGAPLLPVRIEGSWSGQMLTIHLARGIRVEVPAGIDRQTLLTVLQTVTEATPC